MKLQNDEEALHSCTYSFPSSGNKFTIFMKWPQDTLEFDSLFRFFSLMFLLSQHRGRVSNTCVFILKSYVKECHFSTYKQGLLYTLSPEIFKELKGQHYIIYFCTE